MDEEKILYRQRLLKLSVIALGVALMIALGVIVMGSFKTTKPLETSTLAKKETPSKLQESLTKEDNEKIWRTRMEQQNEKIVDDFDSVRKDLAEKQESMSLRKDAEIAELKEKMKWLQEAVLEQQNSANTHSAKPVAASGEELSEVSKITLKLHGESKHMKMKEIKTIENTIPAGAFAQGVLIGGIDAATGIHATSDERPVLVRLVDHGNLPRKLKSDLKDCHLVGGGYGDLSSERVFMRLESLTCTHVGTGEIIETKIAGYIAGEDGKAGLRGKVVAKDTAYLQSSLATGVLGGIGKTLTPQPLFVNPLGGGVISQPNVGQRFTQGFGDGTSAGLDRLSEYYIEKAESLQPVIQVSGGRKVDVVFTASSQIGSSLLSKSAYNSKERAAKSVRNQLEGSHE